MFTIYIITLQKGRSRYFIWTTRGSYVGALSLKRNENAVIKLLKLQRPLILILKSKPTVYINVFNTNCSDSLKIQTF